MITSSQFRFRSPLASRAVAPAFVFGALALASACGSRPFQAPNPQPEGQADKFYAVNPIRDLDLVFMIDNSGSMKEEQDNLRKNFPALIESLRNIPGGLPNVHIGVISSDVGAGGTFISGNPACNRPGGDRGAFLAKAGCGLTDGARFIQSLNNGTQNNFTGTLENVFSCIAELGISGCGFEHQLQSVRTALANTSMMNGNFLRENAFLAVVLITDEDDCSAEPDSDLFVDQGFPEQQGSLRCNIAGHLCGGAPPPAMPFNRPLSECTANPSGRLIPVEALSKFVFSLKEKFPERIIVSAITGMPNGENAPYAFTKTKAEGGLELLDVEPVCASAGGSAAPALRIKKFVEAFGENGTMDSICSNDFRPALKRIGDLIAARLDPGCIAERLIDTDDKAAGIQPECSVVDRVPNSVAGGFEDKVIPACGAGGATPCWRLQAPGAEGNMCKSGEARIQVDRGGKEAVPGTLQSVKCRTCARSTDSRCEG